jgi:hypothetical protein
MSIMIMICHVYKVQNVNNRYHWNKCNFEFKRSYIQQGSQNGRNNRVPISGDVKMDFIMCHWETYTDAFQEGDK